jgi:hypothetical protein
MNQHSSFLFSSLGVHAVLKRGSKMSYALFNLANGKAEPGGVFPAETASFLSKTSAIPMQLNPSVVVSFDCCISLLHSATIEHSTQGPFSVGKNFEVENFQLLGTGHNLAGGNSGGGVTYFLARKKGGS